MEQIKALYESLLESDELKMFFPKMTGDWEKDKNKFIKLQKGLEGNGINTKG